MHWIRQLVFYVQIIIIIMIKLTSGSSTISAESEAKPVTRTGGQCVVIKC